MTKQNKIQIFNDRRVRTVWDSDKEEWFFSVVDVVAALTDSENPSTYWKVLKNRLKKEGNETVTNCNRLKLPAADGKMRLTDVANTEQLFRIIQSIPSPKAEPFKQWMAQVAARSGGNVAKAARVELESKLGRSVISSHKATDYLPPVHPGVGVIENE